jgi:hypothetical protein
LAFLANLAGRNPERAQDVSEILEVVDADVEEDREASSGPWCGNMSSNDRGGPRGFPLVGVHVDRVDKREPRGVEATDDMEHAWHGPSHGRICS